MLYQALTKVAPAPGSEKASGSVTANILIFGGFWCGLVRFFGFMENGKEIAGGARLRRADSSEGAWRGRTLTL